jgi:hypothetical protein
VTGRARVDEFYVRFPFRFHEAFAAGEVTLEQFAIGVYLAGECYRNLNLNGGRAAFRLGALMEAVGYEKTDDSMRADLKALLEGKWIGYRVPAPSERRTAPAWTFWLEGLAVRVREQLDGAPAEPTNPRPNPRAPRRPARKA